MALSPGVSPVAVGGPGVYFSRRAARAREGGADPSLLLLPDMLNRRPSPWFA
jgi:hypothetical protein